MTAITDDLPARLLHEENAGWEAILGGTGGAYYQREMTDDGLMIVPGAVITRDQVTAYFDQAAPWESYGIHEPAIIRLGEHAGVVVYKAIARRGEVVAELNMSTTYLFVNGGWRVAARQQCPA
ncbi:MULTISPECIES: nuclear transport factor 2 family protein [Cryobacterium]|uniref:Nuclear transport factor 2 family protein n=1 Tax=Cryobacterium levicorallinum TaxID=995038 RepID=A0A1I2XNB9_9MICO|nr:MULTISPECIES: nuclear transport factor 2 family protein [Cryobacterium]TFB84905.1 nuclear transport factor 2 family protein [Cryobacterium levicorallinum]TFD57912.1 nuclear transport factor 2 family protein [Cryobacterium sp. Hh38]GEP26093.1 hypothetical protein CLE01_06910 [Cryobacterium levicorallinum]SFH14993.1 hypothetical protein SAMN05216274_10153 [Cryobacterium levicorallinum]